MSANEEKKWVHNTLEQRIKLSDICFRLFSVHLAFCRETDTGIYLYFSNEIATKWATNWYYTMWILVLLWELYEFVLKFLALNLNYGKKNSMTAISHTLIGWIQFNLVFKTVNFLISSNIDLFNQEHLDEKYLKVIWNSFHFYIQLKSFRRQRILAKWCELFC